MQATSRILLALVTFLALVGSAAAASSVSINDLAAEAGTLEGGQSASLPFKVNYVGDGFGCPQGGSVTIALEVTGTPPPGVIAAVEPAEVTISIPAGLYMSLADGAPVAPFNGSADATLTVSAENVTQNASLPLTVVGTYAGGTPTGCQGGDPGQASGEAGTTAELVAPPPEPVVQEVEEEPKSFLPAPGVVPALAAVAAALAVAGRRRHG